MAKTTTTTTSSNGSAKETAFQKLSKPQQRIVRYLKKLKSPVSRKQISEKAKVDYAMLNSYIGSNDVDRRKANDAKSGKCLITLGYVNGSTVEGERGVHHALTAKGKKLSLK